MKLPFALLCSCLLLNTACSKQEPESSKKQDSQVSSSELSQSKVDKAPHKAGANPLIQPWDTPYQIPPFAEIEDAHFKPAFEQALVKLRKEIDVIVSNEEDPTFDNTILALELAGEDITRINRVFSSLTSTDTNDTLKALQVEIYPKLTREYDAILLNQVLFKRVKSVYEQRDPLKLDTHDARLLELTHRNFIRKGAGLDEQSKTRLKEINSEITKLTTQFSQNLLAETKSFELVVDKKEDLAGLSEQMIKSAKLKAEKKGKDNSWVFGLDRATYEGFMTFSEKRELRKIMFDGYRARGAQGNDTDNRELVLNIAKLRAERAALLGYASHAHYQLETRMAKTPQQAEDFLLKVWQAGLQRTQHERDEMQAIVKSEGHDFSLAGHDWWHYAEKLRGKKYAFDESQVKPYFQLENVLSGAFHVAEKLFGLHFKELSNVPVWHPKVKVFEVTGKDNQHLGVFLIDFFSRDSKRGGAWMSSFRLASSAEGKIIRPLITNNLNLTPAAEGDPVLLSFDQVETLFHEFGHGLHGLMSIARYNTYSGTSGSPRDYTEFPAQFLEHYASAPEVLPVYAKHYQTGEVLPEALVKKLQAASTHNQGFKTTEYIAASLLDLAWHKHELKALSEIKDVEVFESQVLKDYGLPDIIGPRYRSPYFAHIFSSPSGYSAGYYAYLWSEILDADGFTAFREAGDIYDSELAKRLAENVYQAGGIAPADELYRSFRQKDPTIEPLLKIRGLQ